MVSGGITVVVFDFNKHQNKVEHWKLKKLKKTKQWLCITLTCQVFLHFQRQLEDNPKFTPFYFNYVPPPFIFSSNFLLAKKKIFFSYRKDDINHFRPNQISCKLCLCTVLCCTMCTCLYFWNFICVTI